jgi:transposase
MRTGIQTGIGVLIPKLAGIKTAINLSKQAKLRLQWVDYYHSHDNNARLTCRHFGICHRTFYRYYERFKKQGLVGLEVCSHRPTQVEI